MPLFKELPIGQRFQLERLPKIEWVKIEPILHDSGSLKYNVRRVDGEMYRAISHSSKVILPPYGDTTKAQRQKKRRSQVKELVTAAGWSSTEELLTAFLDGRVEVPKKP
jgi:hypothetical protein